MFAKRAQAAMEFLMTYGWAILVVLIVVGALAYFGVLNPSNLIPERCAFPASLTCNDYQIGSAGNFWKLVITNGLGKDIIVNGTTISSDVGVITAGCNFTWTGAVGQPPVIVVPATQTATLCVGPTAACGGAVATGACTMDATKINTKRKYTVNVIYSFTDSAYLHPVAGEIFGKSS